MTHPEIDLAGFIDLHIHTAPDIVPRKFTDMEMAQQALEANMAGIMLKSHVTCTADRATIAQESLSNRISVWGGLALNRAVGGLNPYAVEAAIQLGARQIWMPTMDADNDAQFSNKATPGLSILDESDNLLPDVKTILKLIADADVILGTGHISAKEVMRLVPAARDVGVQRILITHPDSPSINLSIESQQQLATDGCYFERCWLPTTSAMATARKAVSVASLLHRIHSIGYETTVLSTDMGQPTNPSPVDGLRAFVSACLQDGFGFDEVQRMGAVNPKMLVEV